MACLSSSKLKGLLYSSLLLDLKSFDFVVFVQALTTIYLSNFDCFGSVCVFVR